MFKVKTKAVKETMPLNRREKETKKQFKNQILKKKKVLPIKTVNNCQSLAKSLRGFSLSGEGRIDYFCWNSVLSWVSVSVEASPILSFFYNLPMPETITSFTENDVEKQFYRQESIISTGHALAMFTMVQHTWHFYSPAFVGYS